MRVRKLFDIAFAAPHHLLTLLVLCNTSPPATSPPSLSTLEFCPLQPFPPLPPLLSRRPPPPFSRISYSSYYHRLSFSLPLPFSFQFSLPLPSLLPQIGTLAQFGDGSALGSVAQCAQNCLGSNAGAAPSCAGTDYGCYCRSTPFINAVSCCLQATCNSTEQKMAITYTAALCASYNISVPNYLVCAPDSTLGFNTSAVSFPSTIFVTALQSASTVESYVAAYITAGGGPVETGFAGAPLLTGSCTAVVFAVYTAPAGVGGTTTAAAAEMAGTTGMGAGVGVGVGVGGGGSGDGVAVMEFPYVGCQNQGCCPFNPGRPGPVTVCPHDYYTTAGGCCPSGWSLATTPIAGSMTYCATQPAAIYLPASTAQNGHAAVISDTLFTLRYDLGTVPSTSLRPGAIAGIAVGSIFGSLALGLAGLLLYRQRQRRAQKIRNATLPTPSGAGQEHVEFSPVSKSGGGFGERVEIGEGASAGEGGLEGVGTREQIVEAPGESEVVRSELPSPPPPPAGLVLRFGDGGTQGVGVAAGSPEMYYTPVSGEEGPVFASMIGLDPQELPGSTHMHEHHPAMRSGIGDEEDEEKDGSSSMNEEREKVDHVRESHDFEEDTESAGTHQRRVQLEDGATMDDDDEDVEELYNGGQDRDALVDEEKIEQNTKATSANDTVEPASTTSTNLEPATADTRNQTGETNVQRVSSFRSGRISSLFDGFRLSESFNGRTSLDSREMRSGNTSRQGSEREGGGGKEDQVG